MGAGKWAIGALIFLAAISFAGCGREAVKTDVRGAEAEAVMPAWAPGQPSPEFLRAAKVLKPMPEKLISNIAAKSEVGGDILNRSKKTWPAAFELFGSLSDEQIKQFRTDGEIRLAIKSLSKEQRAALDRYFSDYQEAMKGVREDVVPADMRADLRKQGGAEDLSNTDIGFVFDGHGINLQFWLPDGATPSNTVAYMEK